jgi:hypothetical protein
MATSASGAGAPRGGWKNPLLTDNTLADPKAQPSLSEGLRAGVQMAHRQLSQDPVRTGDARNFRRSLPLGGQAKPGVRETSMAKRKPGQTASPEQAGATAIDTAMDVSLSADRPRNNATRRTSTTLRK